MNFIPSVFLERLLYVRTGLKVGEDLSKEATAHPPRAYMHVGKEDMCRNYCNPIINFKFYLLDNILKLPFIENLLCNGK